MKIVPSRQKALSELSLKLGEMVSYCGRSQESLDLIWPYCSSDSIVLYRLVDNRNLTVVSRCGRLTPHQVACYDSFNIGSDAYAQLLTSHMLTFESASAMGLSLPALQEDGILSGMIFPIANGDKLEAIIVFISYNTDTWAEDTVDWITTASAVIACAIRRTVTWGDVDVK